MVVSTFDVGLNRKGLSDRMTAANEDHRKTKTCLSERCVFKVNDRRQEDFPQ